MAEFASFWFGGPLSGFENLCISSFVTSGHRYRLYTYDSDLVVPEGCAVFPASDIFPLDKVFFYSENQNRKVSAFSNMFRYKLIYDTGICWVDTDVVCLSRDFPEHAYVFSRQDEEYFNGAVLRFPEGHEAMLLAAEYCWEVRKTSVWGDLGPRLLTKVIAEYRLESEASDMQKFYPVHWREAMSLFDPELREQVSARADHSFLLHLWNETFSGNGIDKNRMPPAGSYAADLIRRLGAEKYFTSGG